jgi:hypothetical protein
MAVATVSNVATQTVGQTGSPGATSTVISQTSTTHPATAVTGTTDIIVGPVAAGTSRGSGGGQALTGPAGSRGGTGSVTGSPSSRRIGASDDLIGDPDQATTPTRPMPASGSPGIPVAPMPGPAGLITAPAATGGAGSAGSPGGSGGGGLAGLAVLAAAVALVLPRRIRALTLDAASMRSRLFFPVPVGPA